MRIPTVNEITINDLCQEKPAFSELITVIDFGLENENNMVWFLLHLTVSSGEEFVH